MPSLRFGSEEKDLPSAAIGDSWLSHWVAAARSFHDGISTEAALSAVVGIAIAPANETETERGAVVTSDEAWRVIPSSVAKRNIEAIVTIPPAFVEPTNEGG